MSDWFVELSDETKRSFFLDLLANLHRGTFSKQREVINSDQFNNLTGKLKAKLIYRTGITALVDGEKHHTLWCLRESLKQKVDLQALIAFGLILFFGLELTRKLVVVHQSYRRRRHVGSKNLDVSILLGINTPRE